MPLYKYTTHINYNDDDDNAAADDDDDWETTKTEMKYWNSNPRLMRFRRLISFRLRIEPQQQQHTNTRARINQMGRLYNICSIKIDTLQAIWFYSSLFFFFSFVVVVALFISLFFLLLFSLCSHCCCMEAITAMISEQAMKMMRMMMMMFLFVSANEANRNWKQPFIFLAIIITKPPKPSPISPSSTSSSASSFSSSTIS